MSVQFFTHDEDEMKAYNVFKAMLEPFRLSVASMYQNYDLDPNFGTVLKNANVVPFSNIVQPELFKYVWGRLIKMIEEWGASDILDFMLAVYGVNVTITVNPPMNISMVANIDPENTREDYWIAQKRIPQTPIINYEDHDYVLGRVEAADYKMLFKRYLGDILSLEQLTYLLQHLRPAGERWVLSYKG